MISNTINIFKITKNDDENTINIITHKNNENLNTNLNSGKIGQINKKRKIENIGEYLCVFGSCEKTFKNFCRWKLHYLSHVNLIFS